MTIEELKMFAVEMGEKPFRGKQIFIWLNRGVRDFDEMTDLPMAFRDRLKEACSKGDLNLGGVSVSDVQTDIKDGTRKFLFRCEEGSVNSGFDFVEGVFMRYRYGNSLCISSQVGCKMGCTFCASALGGFVRNLTAGEMLGQVLSAERATSENINHIVVMGIGEPFDNYENVAKFLNLLHEKDGKNLSFRNMTVSTSGIIPKILQFAKDFPQVNLAISLHKLTDEGRNKIMPINRKYPIDELLKAAREYTELTNRRVTFEYTLIAGENDSNEDMDLLQNKLKGMLCHINLIPLNTVKESQMKSSSRMQAEYFASRLEAIGIPATVRRELGTAIDGACGQLRLKSLH